MHAIHPVKYTASNGRATYSGDASASRLRQCTSVPVNISDGQPRTLGARSSCGCFWRTTAMSDAGDETEEAQLNSFFGTILEPGSSLNPAFLLVVDGTFASLFIVLASFTALTRGNIHLISLTFIELALWASVKWYVISRSRWGRHAINISQVRARVEPWAN